MTFDILQAVFWSLTYILVILHIGLFKINPMPACVLIGNFSWELTAICKDFPEIINGDSIFDNGLLIHIAWVSIDAIIIIVSIANSVWNLKKTAMVLACSVSLSIFLYFVFDIPGGMLVSCFTIDIFMAIYWFIDLKNIKEVKYPTCNRFILLIGISKFLGDLFAFLYYSEFSIFVTIAGLIVLLFNIGFCAVSAKYYYICRKTI